MSAIGVATNEYLDGVTAIVEEVARSLAKIDATTAAAISDEVVRRISQEHGGQLIYISKDTARAAERTEAAVATKLAETRQNYAKTAAALGLSIGYIYEVAKRITDRERANRQPKLFQDAP